MEYRFVFLLGRPGSGKSSLYHELRKRILESGRARTIERIDDFPKLWSSFQRDDAFEREGKERIYSSRTADGHYLIANEDLLNDILIEINSDLLKVDQPGRLIFLEFARSNYVEALQQFDKRILANSMTIYMEAAFDICWARNVARHEAAVASAIAEGFAGGTAGGGDDHLVPRDEMEKRYLYDDQDAFVRHMREHNIAGWVVNNETNEEHLRERVKELFEANF